LILALEKDKKPKTFLEFPGKITADESSKRLFISDSGHNRIIVTDFNGKLLETIGSGKEGRADGNFLEAQFNHPQGLAYNRDYLYIADTENHSIRRIDLINKTVTTIAKDLSSPWDLVWINDTLFIAMAGKHQIWSLDLNRGTLKVHAGSGHENIADNKLLKSDLAQTSGITTDGDKLYFADSEVSAVRVADIDPQGEVNTLIGHGLFNFGDIDGNYQTARLQHPLGVYYHNGLIYTADTYNNKIKIINPADKTSRTFASGLNEPGGLTFAQGKFFVADTNNHRIVTIAEDGGAPSAFAIPSKPSVTKFNLNKFKGERIRLPARGAINQFVLNLRLDKEYQLLKPTQSSIRVYNENLAFLTKTKIEEENTTLDLSQNDPNVAFIELTIFYCRHGKEGLCLIKNVLFEIPINGEPSSDLNLEYNLPSGKYK
jgi:sugar lactone lactonase YvrE